MGSSNANDFSKPHLPTKKTGVFTGERGNSGFVPNNREALEKIKSFGVDRVEYVKGYPDFSPFTSIQDEKLGKINGQVEIGHMTTNRQNPHYEYGRRTDSHAMNEDLGNFAQADNELAKSLNALNGTDLTGKDIQEMRERNNLTWHEVQDGKTMLLVPTQIHDACPHSGGVSVEKDLYRIADSEVYDFDTGEYNAMDYIYDEERDELTPVNKNKVSSGEYTPKEDEYVYSGKVDANPQYGNGGGTQYFMPYANEMKEDGRLVAKKILVEDPSKRTGSGEPKLVHQYVDKNGVNVILDLRPMDEDELKQLQEECPDDPDEDRSWTGDEDDLSDEEIAQLQEEVPPEDFLRNYGDEYKHPLTNQESAGTAYSPDGWSGTRKMMPGEIYYQLSVDGNTKSCYFTDQETIDACTREDGSVNFDTLREKLQIGKGDNKITLVQYEFHPPLEGEITDPTAPGNPDLKNETNTADSTDEAGKQKDEVPVTGEPAKLSEETAEKDNTAIPAAEPVEAKNVRMVDPNDIDMTYAMGMDSDQFWNHHGNTKEDYIKIAEKIPEVQKELDSGKTLEEIRKNPDLQSTVHAYFDPKNMVKVELNQDGSYSFIDDGRHRVMAAKECGFEIPVKVENMPETVETQDARASTEPTVMQTGETTVEQPGETVLDTNGTPLDDEAKRYRAAMSNMSDYLSEHNYGPEDYDTYSKDPKWQKLNGELQKSLGMEVTQYPETKESVETRYRDAMDNMGKYLSEHNYGREDYGTYSQDPEWQKLNEELKEAIQRKENFHEDTSDTTEEQKKPENTSETEDDKKPEDTSDAEDEKKPEKTSETEDERKPEDTSETEDEKKPEDTSDAEDEKKPEDTSDAEDEKKPEKTSETEDEKQPENTSDVEDERKPENTSEREDEKQPENTSDAEDEKKPEKTSETENEKKPEDTSDAEDDKKPEKTPETEDDKKPEDTSDAEDDKKPEDTSEAKDERKPEDTSDAEDERKPEDTSDAEDDKKSENTSDAEDDKKPENISDAEDDKKPEKTSETENEKKPEDTSDAEDDKKPEKTPETEDDKKPEDTSDAEDDKKPEKTPETEDEKKPENISDAEDERKPEKTSETEDETKKPEDMPDTKLPPDDLTVDEPKKNDPTKDPENNTLAPDDLTVDEPKKNEPTKDPENNTLTPDDLTVDEPKKNDPANDTDNEVLMPDDLNVENKQADGTSDEGETMKIDTTTVFDDQGNPLSKEEQEKYYEALNEMADYHSEHGYTQEDFDTYSQDPKWQELNEKYSEASKALHKDDLNVEDKKKQDKKEETLESDDLTTGNPEQDKPEQYNVEEPPKVEPPENPDGGDGGGGNRR